MSTKGARSRASAIGEVGQRTVAQGVDQLEGLQRIEAFVQAPQPRRRTRFYGQCPGRALECAELFERRDERLPEAVGTPLRDLRRELRVRVVRSLGEHREPDAQRVEDARVVGAKRLLRAAPHRGARAEGDALGAAVGEPEGIARERAHRPLLAQLREQVEVLGRHAARGSRARGRSGSRAATSCCRSCGRRRASRRGEALRPSSGGSLRTRARRDGVDGCHRSRVGRGGSDARARSRLRVRRSLDRSSRREAARRHPCSGSRATRAGRVRREPAPRRRRSFARARRPVQGAGSEARGRGREAARGQPGARRGEPRRRAADLRRRLRSVRVATARSPRGRWRPNRLARSARRR